MGLKKVLLCEEKGQKYYAYFYKLGIFTRLKFYIIEQFFTPKPEFK